MRRPFLLQRVQPRSALEDARGCDDAEAIHPAEDVHQAREKGKRLFEWEPSCASNACKPGSHARSRRGSLGCESVAITRCVQASAVAEAVEYEIQ